VAEEKRSLEEYCSSSRDANGNQTSHFEARFGDGSAWSRTVIVDSLGRRTSIVIATLWDGTKVTETKSQGLNEETQTLRTTLMPSGAWSEELAEAGPGGRTMIRKRLIEAKVRDSSETQCVHGEARTTVSETTTFLEDGSSRKERAIVMEPGSLRSYFMEERDSNGIVVRTTSA
jgi:hypothetical protein